MAAQLWPDGTLIQEGDHLIFYKYGPHFYGRENEFSECSQEKFTALMKQRFGPDWKPRAPKYAAPVVPAPEPEPAGVSFEEPVPDNHLEELLDG